MAKTPAHTADHAHAQNGHIGRGTYYKVFGGLMVLMIMTVAAWWIEKNIIALPGWVAVSIAMIIAIAKTALIILFFMHVKISSKVTQLFAMAAFAWLLILFIITMGDYLARGWPPQLGPLT